jgi:serine/threonine protein kinase
VIYCKRGVYFMEDSMVGRFLGQYELMELIGKGGMARVYKSIQPALKRHVAVKLLHPSVAADEEFLARFQREAQAAASLRHPNIVQIFDFGHQKEFYYMVMELIDGPTSRDELQRLRALDQTLPFSEVQRIVGEVSERRHSTTPMTEGSSTVMSSQPMSSSPLRVRPFCPISGWPS